MSTQNVYFLFSLSVFVLVFIDKSTGTVDSSGSNVCSKSVSFSQSYNQSYQFSQKVRTTYKCGQWDWGRCTRYKTVYSTRYRDATKQAYKTLYECCKGWKQSRSSCSIAICTQQCVNGRCTKPEYCSCNSGYYGKLCDRDCPPHKWGPPLCKHDCLCQNNAKCSLHAGNCTCAPGWEGQYCNKSCDQGYYGDKCKNKCECQNGAYCNPINGTCTCAPGYRGLKCDGRCPRGFYGQDCSLQCACQNGATCDNVNGTCNCTAGWTGDICIHKCPQGTYGYKCAQKCLDCMHGATCDHVTGVCDCRPGYTGLRCENLCEERTYGLGCKKSCACQNNATCSPRDGFCNCTSRFTGKLCEKQYSGGDGRSEDRINPVLLLIVLSVSVLVIIAGVVIAFIVYRRRQRTRKETQLNDPIYEVAENPQTNNALKEDEDKGMLNSERPSYMELTNVAQTLYQALTPRQSRGPQVDDVSPAAMATDTTAIENPAKETYQPLTKNSGGVYQPLKKSNKEGYKAKSPVPYDTSDPVSYDTSDCPVLYENLPVVESRSNDDELYLTVLPDRDDTQPTYEILPASS